MVHSWEEAQKEIRKMDLVSKMLVVKNIYNACQAETKKGGTFEARVREEGTPLDVLVQDYTGVKTQLLKKYLEPSLNDPNATKTFKEYCQETSQPENIEFNKTLRDTILSSYFKLDYPKASTLFDQNSFDESSRLERTNYTQKIIEGTSKVILVERPEKFFERFGYLEEINDLRLSYNIVYICNLNTENASAPREYVAILPSVGILGVFFSFSSDTSNSIKELESWILSAIVPKLLAPSVIVLDESIDSKDCITLPTMDSKPSEMIEWLKAKNIPHPSDMLRPELYELIKRSKRGGPAKMYKIDTQLNAKGHKVLRQPKGVECLKYIKKSHIKALVHKINNIKDQVTSQVDMNPLDSWLDLEKSLVKLEEKMYHEDLALENIIDQILTLGKYSPESSHLFDDKFDDVPDNLKFTQMFGDPMDAFCW